MLSLSFLPPLSWASIGLALAVTYLAVCIGKAIYGLYFHPLSKYPGPRLCAITILPHVVQEYQGLGSHWIKKLHEQYGEVVRYAPDGLSFISPQAWRDIYGHRSGGKKTMPKDPRTYIPESNGEFSIITTPDVEEHAALRHIFSHGFSDRAIRQQEHIILRYADQFISVTKKQAMLNAGGYIDISQLFNFATFDIMAELTFGEPLGLLRQSSYTPWVRQIFQRFKFIGTARIGIEYPLVGFFINLFLRKGLAESRRKNLQHNADRVDRRMARGNTEPDFWNLVLSNKNVSLSRDKMIANSSSFMSAGSETTATILSGCTFFLLKNPDKLRKVQAEVRSQPSEAALDVDTLPRLKYLNACFDEALRLYPPVPIGLPRVVPEGGASIAGQWVPGQTRVSLAQLAAYHSPLYFKDAESFIPERWLPGTGYEDDKKDVVQPFSVGPRVCIGKNLAQHEFRIILAKLIWNFDLELDPSCSEWLSQKVYTIWEKPALRVRVRPVTQR